MHKQVALLQAILAIVLVTGKTLHEQSKLMARSSELSRPSLLSQLQPEASLSPSSSCTCQAASRVCFEVTTTFTAKVFSLANKVLIIGVTWFKQIWIAVNCVREKMMKAQTSFLWIFLAISCYLEQSQAISSYIKLYQATWGYLRLYMAISGNLLQSVAISGYLHQVSSIRMQVKAVENKLLTLA